MDAASSLSPALFAEARDPTTLPARLDELAKIDELASWVAGNPNANIETLSTLAEQYPREFLANPALPLHLLADPEMPDKLSGSALMSILRCEQVPLAFLRMGIYHRQHIRAEIAMHVQVAGEEGVGWSDALAQYPSGLLASGLISLLNDLLALPDLLPVWFKRLLISHISGAVRERVLLAPWCPPLVVQWLWTGDATVGAALVEAGWLTPAQAQHFHPLDTNARRRNRLIVHGDAPSFMLAWFLAQREVPRLRYLAMKHPRLSPDTARHYITDDDAVLRRLLANHTDLAASSYHALFADDDLGVRCALARNPALPAPLLALLVDDTDPHIRRNVAHNPGLVEAQLVWLARHGDRLMRLAVAQHEAMPPDYLTNLAHDAEAGVRSMVACNVSTPLATLTALMGDVAGAVRAAAHRTHAFVQASAELAADDAPARIAAIPNPLVRRRIAHLPNLPSAVLVALADDPDEVVRTLVALHPQTPPALLIALLEADQHPITVLMNPSLPNAIREQKIRHLMSASVVDMVFTSANLTKTERTRGWELYFTGRAHFDNWKVKHSNPAILSPLVSPEILVQQQGSHYWADRFIVAMNPRTPNEVMANLAHDGNCYVRYAARTLGWTLALIPQRDGELVRNVRHASAHPPH